VMCNIMGEVVDACESSDRAGWRNFRNNHAGTP
jgi:hypothetical protein